MTKKQTKKAKKKELLRRQVQVLQKELESLEAESDSDGERKTPAPIRRPRRQVADNEDSDDDLTTICNDIQEKKQKDYLKLRNQQKVALTTAEEYIKIRESRSDDDVGVIN